MLGRLKLLPFTFIILMISSRIQFSFAKTNDLNIGKIDKGQINLTIKNLRKEKSISLEGDWLFFWNELLPPKNEKIETRLVDSHLLKIPGAWRSGKDRSLKNFNDYGFSSYALEVKGVPKGTKLSLMATEISSSYKIMIVYKNSYEDLGGLGKVGNKVNNSTPQSGQFLNDFIVKEKNFKILIHVSNFHHRDGGPLKTIKIGLKKDLKKQFDANNHGSFFILGVFLIMAINHLGIYFQRKEDKESLWFALFCLTMTIRYLSINSYFDIFFDSPGILAYALGKKLEYLTFFLIGQTFLTFLKCIFDNYFSDILLKWYWRLGLVLSTITILTPVSFFTRLTEAYQYVIILISFFLLFQMTRASIKNIPYSRICLSGNIILIFGAIYDILVARQMVPPPGISLFTSSIFVFIQSYIISKKFSYAYQRAETLNNELEDKIETRTKEISGLLNNLKSSIFYVGEDLKVIPPFSSYSQKLFKKDINGKSVFEFLFISYQTGTRKFNEVSLSFKSIFGDDELNYSFVEVNFPQSIIFADSERPEGRTLKISYSPIYNKEKSVEKLMFIVEDISDFETYYQEAKKDQQSYTFMKEILTISNKESVIFDLKNSIQASIEELEFFLSPLSELDNIPQQMKRYKNFIDKVNTQTKRMVSLNTKIHTKAAEFDYVSIQGEKEYGKRENTKGINHRVEITNKLIDIFDYILLYRNVMNLFSPIELDFSFDNKIEEKIRDLKILLSNLFQKTFLIQDLKLIDKTKLARMAVLAKTYPDFDHTIKLITLRTSYISLLLKSIHKDVESSIFTSIANLFKQIPDQSKLNETIMNQNLILPYKEVLKFSF